MTLNIWFDYTTSIILVNKLIAMKELLNGQKLIDSKIHNCVVDNLWLF